MTPKLYDELARWWPLVSAPAEYAYEAAFYRQALLGVCDGPVRTVLELGSGGGNNASHLKEQFQMTLVDCAPGMLAVSRALNPESEHLEGDMRTIRLGRRFDGVFIHDAIGAMTTEADLRDALRTAYDHCRPGGAAVFAPDHLRETFQASTHHGGHDGDDGRGLRYVEWTWDPDPNDTTCQADYAFLLREADGQVRVEHDRLVDGLFARSVWLGLLAEVGFIAEVHRLEHNDPEDGINEVFVARRPIGSAP